VAGREFGTTSEHPFYVRCKGWLCASTKRLFEPSV
jgi:hypothetical protein